jgi:hypothetical protein
MTTKPPKKHVPNVPHLLNIEPTEVTDSKQAVPAFLLKFGVKPGEWFYGLKTDLRVFMRPGWDLRVRVYAFLLQFTRAYRSEFAMTQVGGDQKFAPVSPAFICSKLSKTAAEEFLKSAHRKPTDAEAAKWVIRPPYMRYILESMQADDGTLTTVTVTKLLASDPTTRKRGRADLQRLMTERLSFKDALNQKLITPIETLGKRDRKRLAGISFIYLHVVPRSATVAALMRRTEDDITASLSQASKDIHAELDAHAQLAFRFLRAEGINDPAFAAELASREEIRLQFDDVQRLDERRLALNLQLRESVHAACEQYKLQRHSAILNPNARESLSPELGTPPAAQAPERRIAGHSSAVNSNGTEPKPNNAPRTATADPMGRQSGRVDPLLHPAGQAAPPLVSQPRKPLTAEQLAPVAAAMGTVGITETRAVSKLFGMCRDEAPDCTPEEVAFWTARKIAVKRGKPVANWTGYLHTSVPHCFEAAGFEKWRAEQRAFDVVESEDQERQCQRARYILNPDADEQGKYDDTDRAWARQILGETERAVEVA